jgi:hypothetical protein
MMYLQPHAPRSALQPELPEIARNCHVFHPDGHRLGTIDLWRLNALDTQTIIAALHEYLGRIPDKLAIDSGVKLATDSELKLAKLSWMGLFTQVPSARRECLS